MRSKEYALMCRVVEEAVPYGWRRAHKYVEQPTPEAIQQAIEEAVLAEICEWFTFEEAAEEA